MFFAKEKGSLVESDQLTLIIGIASCDTAPGKKIPFFSVIKLNVVKNETTIKNKFL